MNKYIISTCQRRTPMHQDISGITQILTAITYHHTMTLKPSFFQNYIKWLINLLSFFSSSASHGDTNSLFYPFADGPKFASTKKVRTTVEWTCWRHRSANAKGCVPQSFLANSVPATRNPKLAKVIKVFSQYKEQIKSCMPTND